MEEYETMVGAHTHAGHNRTSSGGLEGQQEEVVKFLGGSKAARPESHYYLSIHKAGLESVDKERVHAIIQEASKSSEFYKNEEKKLNEVKEKC